MTRRKSDGSLRPAHLGHKVGDALVVAQKPTAGAFCISADGRRPVTAVLKQTVNTQLSTAVEQARHARHHQDCRCANYRRGGAPYCTPSESTWCGLVDRLIDVVRTAQEKNS